ncbi:MAG: ABC transporter ATP-binding protein/permease, partial [Gammaproteobacteria bacterium]|nr:ABC transporter ATP-binding protein/permease [Gammaproteobacteria bacterium]
MLFLFMSPKLALFFLLGGVLAIAIGYRATIPIAATTLKHRKKESAYARMIHQALGHGDIHKQSEDSNMESANIEVHATRLIAISSLQVQVTLAVVTAIALLFAVREVRLGSLVPGDLFVFIAYILMVHRRMVQVGRQLARGGKMLANVRRVGTLGTLVRATPSSGDSKQLTSTIELRNISLDSPPGRTGPQRLSKVNVLIPARTRTIVLGEPGSGKTALLKVMAGRYPPDSGSILWDGEQITGVESVPMLSLSYLPQNPVFKPVRMWKLLNLQEGEEPGPDFEKMLRRLGAWKIITRRPRGLDEKLSSEMISLNEARALTISSILPGKSDVWIFDAPLEGL